jgi:enoyl-CoA hydratase/carnithine racemase
LGIASSSLRSKAMVMQGLRSSASSDLARRNDHPTRRRDSMNFETLVLHQDGPVLTVTLSNPPINLMSLKMIEELFQLAGRLMPDRETRVVVFESADPDFFLAHFDLNDILAVQKDPSKDSRYPDINGIQAVGLAWQNLPQIKILKLDGRVRGGGLEFALALDMRFATANSILGFPETAGGFIPSGGGSTRTLMMAGPGRALEILMSARDFSGTEAERYGLINRAFDDRAALDAYVATLANEIGDRSWVSIKGVRDVMGGLFASSVDSVFAGFAAENEGLRAGLSTEEMQAGMRYHLEMGQTRENELDLRASMKAARSK